MLTCRHCAAKFDGRHDRKGRVIFGLTPQQEEAHMAVEAVTHLKIRHPDKYQQLEAITQMVVANASGLALMAQMEDDNPEAKAKQQMAAAVICRSFGRVVTDEDLLKQVERHAADLFAPGDVYSLLRQLRDTLTFADVIQEQPTAPPEAA